MSLRSLLPLLATAALPLVASAGAPPDPKRTVVLIGSVIEHGTLVCKPGDFPGTWTDLHHQVGTVRVDADGLEKHRGKAVVVVGEVTEEGRPEPKYLGGGCLPAQMRSDWEPTPGGMRIWHGSPADFRRVRATSVTPLALTVSAKKPGRARVQYTHPDIPGIKAIRLVMHYEGCYGKPGSDEVTSPPLPVKPGKTVSYDFPVLSGDKDRDHVATSVRLSAEGEGVVFDLDASLYRHGLDTKCPRD